MSAGSRVNEAATCMLGLAIMAAFFLLFALLLRGMVWVSDKALPWLLLAGSRTFDICFFVLLPLCFFKKTRPWAGLGFCLASYVFGVTVWAFSCVVTFGHWGYVGLIIGLLLGGFGVFPVALLAVSLHAEWSVVGWLLLGLVLTFGTLFIGVTLIDEKPARETTDV